MNRLLALCLVWGMALSALPGVAGQSRPEPIDVLHYRFHLTLSDSTDQLRGRAEITVRFLADDVEAFELDLVGRSGEEGTGMDVAAVTSDRGTFEFTHSADRLRISLPSPARAEELRSYSVVYSGVPADGLIIGTNMFGDRTFFGDNWPDRARHWIPTADRLADKATVEWIVSAPEGYDVVANGRLVERSRLADGMELTHWESTAPIPTKVMVIGVARFAMRTTGFVDGIPVEAWVYPQNREAGFHDFAFAEEVLRFFQDHIGPFPFAKLANVQSKTRFGGMENASAIFYTEAAVRGDRAAEQLIVHEVAHQWFGDAVTEQDWPDLWLSEGFATYLTHYYVELNYGRDPFLAGMDRDRREVIRFLSEEPELALVPNRVADPAETLNPNAYQKGSWILHMLRRQVGEGPFWEGIRGFYDEYRNRNASTDDLRRVMERTSGQELAWFFHQWADAPGHPKLEGLWSYDPSSNRLLVEVRQNTGTGHPFRFPLDIGIQDADGSVRTVGTVQVLEQEQTFVLPLLTAPENLILDPDTWLLFEGALVKG